MIVSTRESQESRERVLSLGVSQISGGSSTSVGGYYEKEAEEDNSAQFDVSDQRTLDEIVRWLMEMGDIPSFCTACYRAEEPATVLCPCARANRSSIVVIRMH